MAVLLGTTIFKKWIKDGSKMAARRSHDPLETLKAARFNFPTHLQTEPVALSEMKSFEHRNVLVIQMTPSGNVTI